MTKEEHVQHLFDVSCSNKDKRNFDNVGIAYPADDHGSVVISIMGSVASCDNESPLQDDINSISNTDTYDNPDWENLNRTERERNIVNTVKKLGNMKENTRAHSS